MTEFNVGDAVVYPPHGSGTVEGFQDREGSDDQLMAIRIAHSKMTLSVPASLAKARGVRPVASAAEVDALLITMVEPPKDLAATPQLRARAAADIERSGDARQLVEAIRDYVGKEREGGKLTGPERRSLDAAKRTFASELALVRDIPMTEAEQLIDDTIDAAAGTAE